MWRNVQVKAGWAQAEMPADTTMMDDFSDMTSLTAQQRLIGFFMSLAMGIVFIIISLTFVPILAIASKKFAFFFSCGNFFCVSSTAFLVGPAKQVKSMFEAHRSQAAAGYVGSMLMTLVSAIYWRSTSLSIFFAVTQMVTVVWYALSYIPFARRVVGYAFHYASYILKPILNIVWKVMSTFCGVCCNLISRR